MSRRLHKQLSNKVSQTRDLLKNSSSDRGRRLFGSLALIVCSLSCWAQPAQAEGSRTLYPSGATGSRANLEWRTNPVGGLILRRTLLKVYAKKDEYILLGSSAVGVTSSSTPSTSGDIWVFNPGRVSGSVGSETIPGTPDFKCSSQPAIGKINSRAQELAGPKSISGTGNTGGYTPCYYMAPQEGVYDVVIYGPAGINASTDGSVTGEIGLASANNFGSNQGSSVAAWDVTVRSNDTNSTTDLNGRLFSYYLALFTGNNGRPLYFPVYPITNDGYRYKITLRGSDPNGFLLYGNQVGFFDSDGKSILYHNIVGSDGQVSSPEGGTQLSRPQYPTFLNSLDSSALPYLNRYRPDGTSDGVGIPSVPILPSVSSANFAGNFSANTSTLGNGGTFSFSSTAGNYEIIISRDGVNFDPTNPQNRVLLGVMPTSGSQSIVWDGKDNSNNNFPVGANYPVRIRVHAGEYHFPFLDGENNFYGGPTFELLNAANPLGNRTGFYDDRGYVTVGGTTVGVAPNPLTSPLCGNNPPTVFFSDPINGFDTSTNQRAFGAATGGNTNTKCTGSFGDTKGLDLWTYFPSSAASTVVNIIASGSVAGTLYQDSNGDDALTSGETTFPASIAVALYNDANNNNVIDSGEQVGAPVVTDASGNYKFTGVADGSYKIQVDTSDTDIPAGFTLGTPNNLSVTVSGNAITGRNFGFDAPAPNSCVVGGGTPDGSIAPYISAEVRNNNATTRGIVDTLDDAWRSATGGSSSGTLQPWFGTANSPGIVNSFTYRDPALATNVSTTVELVEVPITGTAPCTGLSNSSSSTPQLSTGNALQDASPRPASLYNSANQPAYWNQTIVSGNNSRRFAVRFTFAQPVKSFGAWFGDLETRTANGTPAILRLLDASGNRIGNDIPIDPTTMHDGTPPDPDVVNQSQCGVSPGSDIGCGNNSTRWVGFVDSSAVPRVYQVLVIVGDDDLNDNGDTEIMSFIGANVIPSSPNVLLVKRITAVNGRTATNGGDNLANYINEATNPYDDNTIEPSLAPNPPAYPTPDTDKWLNPSTFLVGGINGGAVQPNDILEYTIYFLSTGAQPAKNVRFCDRVPDNTTFVPTAFGSSPDRGIVVNQGGTVTNLTNVPDTDAGQYFAPGIDPAVVYPGINCGGANTNGAVVVNLGNLPFATGQGVPSQSYGFVRFWGTVK